MKQIVLAWVTVAFCFVGTSYKLVAVSPPQIQILPRKFEEVHRFYGMHFKYPQIASAPRFNARVLEVVRDATGKFRQEMRVVVAKPQYDGYLDGKCKVIVLKNGLVSVLLEWSEYFPGAAHPGRTSVSVNYDTRTGKLLKLSDLFRPDEDYVSQLSKLAMTDLIGREIAEPMVIEHGAGPVEANFQVFTLSDTSLILHFQTYQVAAGQQDHRMSRYSGATLSHCSTEAWLAGSESPPALPMRAK